MPARRARPHLPISVARRRGKTPAIDRTSERDALQITARVGLTARGVVYGVIGILALQLALGAGGRTEDQTGALRTIAHQPFGEALLIILAAGLACYAIWQAIRAAAGIGVDESGEVRNRISALISGGGYAVLCYAAVEILAGRQASGGSPRPATAGVLGWPGGPVLVTIAGAVVIVVGLYQAYKGLSRGFEKESDVERMAPGTRTVFVAIGAVGHVARAVTFGVIGYGLLKAAFDYSAQNAVGLDGALQKLAHATAGRALLGLVAAGFIAFAVYSVADARYHKV